MYSKVHTPVCQLKKAFCDILLQYCLFIVDIVPLHRIRRGRQQKPKLQNCRNRCSRCTLSPYTAVIVFCSCNHSTDYIPLQKTDADQDTEGEEEVSIPFPDLMDNARYFGKRAEGSYSYSTGV